MIRRTKKSATRVKSARFRPVVESLESRLALAGNVTAFAAGPNLYLYGDALDNELRITGTALGALTITGVGTSVNGTANGTLNVTGIWNIVADMGNGNDTARFLTADINGLLRYNGGNGNDNLFFGEGNNGFNSFGSVQALMGAGNDEVSVNDDEFTAFYSFTATNGEGNNTTDLDPFVELFLGVTTITGGSGSDFVDIGDVLVTTGFITVNSGAGDNDFFLDGNVTVNGGISVIGGAGPDNFEPGDGGGNQLTVNGSIVASLGDGVNFTEFSTVNNDITGVISYVGGSGIDTFDFDTTTFDVLSISLAMGAGDNIVLLNEGASTIRGALTITSLGGLDEITGFGLDVYGATLISTGEGNDLIQLDNSRFRSIVTVSTAGGNDTVNVENGNENDGIGSQFDSTVNVDLGAGNDTIVIGFDANDFARFLGRVYVNGGAGTDTITNSAFNVFAFAPLVTNFP